MKRNETKRSETVGWLVDKGKFLFFVFFYTFTRVYFASICHARRLISMAYLPGKDRNSDSDSDNNNNNNNNNQSQFLLL